MKSGRFILINLWLLSLIAAFVVTRLASSNTARSLAELLGLD
jgi:hypothetical protein